MLNRAEPLPPPTGDTGAGSIERSIFECLPRGCVRIRVGAGSDGAEAECTVEDVNPAFELVSGLAEEELAGEPAAAAFAGFTDAHDSLAPLFTKVARTGTPARLEHYADRTRQWYSLYVFRLSFERIAVMVEDITDQYQQAVALQASEAQFREAFLKAGIGKAMAGLDGRFEDVNPAFASILGYETEELRSMSWMDLSPPETIADQERDVGRLVSGELETLNYEVPFLHKQGHRVWCHLNIVLLRNEQGQPCHFLGEIEDIDHRKRADEKMRLEQAFTNSVIDSLPGVFYVLSDTGDFLRVNQHMCDITGRTADELQGLNALALFSEEDGRQVGAAIMDVFTKGRGFAEGSLVSTDGSAAPHFFTGLRSQIEGRTVLVGMGVDKSELLAKERELERLNTELQDKNQDLEQIVYVTSHDLRSPLVNIQGFSKELTYAVDEVCEALSDESVPAAVREGVREAVEEDIPDAIQFIRSSAHKMDRLLGGLLQFSRSGRAVLRPERIEMSGLVEGVVRDTVYAVQEAGVKVEVGPLPPCIGDELQLTQVVSNLVDNAIKYLDPERRGCISIFGEEQAGEVVYKIQDNGIGIPLDHQPKIFEIFHRLDPAATQGEGLGLTMARKVLGRMGGRIWVESEPGSGSRFYIAMPAAGAK